MDAIKTIGLTKKYGPLVAVDHLNLQIRQGEYFPCWVSTAQEKPQPSKCFPA